MDFWITTYPASRQLLRRSVPVVYFNAVVDDSIIIKCTLDLLLKAIGGSHIAQHYGFEPPKMYESQLFMITYGLGFLRGEIDYSLVHAAV